MSLIEVSIVGGMSFVTWFFAWTAFQLRASQDRLNQSIATFFFILSVLLLNFVMLIVYEISETSTIGSLSGGLLLTAFQVVLWATMILTALYVLRVTYGALLWIRDAARTFMTRKKQRYD